MQIQGLQISKFSMENDNNFVLPRYICNRLKSQTVLLRSYIKLKQLVYTMERLSVLQAILCKFELNCLGVYLFSHLFYTKSTVYCAVSLRLTSR